MAVIGFERFDDHLLLAEQVIHEQSYAAAVAFHDDDETFVELACSRLDVEELMQTDDRNVVASEREDFATAGNAVERALFDLERFDDADERNDVALLAYGDGLAIYDGESERQRDDESRAFAGVVSHFDGAAELFDVAPYDVEADAAAGDVCGLLGRRKAWHEDELYGLIVGQRVVGANDPAGSRLGKNSLRV